jgi:protein TonB
MKKKLFESLVEKPKSTKKWFFIPMSMILHGLIVGAVLVIPLMSDNFDRPEIKVVDILMVAPAPPSPPPPPKAPSGKPRRKPKPDNETEARAVPVPVGRLVAPMKIPDEIAEEDFVGAFGIDGSPDGIIGGVPDGVDGGVIGGVLLGEGQAEYQQELRVATVQIPRLLKKVEPQYPTTAIKAHIQGMVLLEAVTKIDGRVRRVRVITGNPLLRIAAVQAVKQWIYEPYIINGIPKPVIFTVSVNFTLQR